MTDVGLKVSASPPPATYRHGGNPAADFERLGLPVRRVIDFSVSLNPLGPPAEIAGRWPEMLRVLRDYPSAEGVGVGRYYSERFGIPSTGVLAGNGATELLYLVPRALGVKRVKLVQPGYHDYGRAARLAGAETNGISLLAGNGFGAPSCAELDDALGSEDALWLGNPNNPTGTLFPAENLLRLSEKRPEILFLVDESFIQFADDVENVSLMRPECLRPNLLVFHSLTKFYALAGLRIGAVIGHPGTIARVRSFKEPWTVNGIAERIAGDLAGCRAFERESRRLISRERSRCLTRMEKMPGLKIFRPSANFFLAQWRATDDLDDLLRRLLEKGLYVRDCRNFPGLEENYFRFAILRPGDNDRLMDALSSGA